MRLSRYEQETIICYNEEEDTASVYTHDNRLIAKLNRLAGTHPDKIRPIRKEYGGANFTIPKRCVSVREPYSDAPPRRRQQKGETSRSMSA